MESSEFEPTPSVPLTDGERSVLRGVVEGKSYAEIALERFTTEATVRGQASKVLGKYGVNSRSQLSALFREHRTKEERTHERTAAFKRARSRLRDKRARHGLQTLALERYRERIAQSATARASEKMAIEHQLLIGPGWIPDGPLRIGEFGPAVNGRTSNGLALVRSGDKNRGAARNPTEPFATGGGDLLPDGYRTYSEAIRDLYFGGRTDDTAFQDRDSYRLTRVRPAQSSLQLEFEWCTYFEYQNTGEILSLELASAVEWAGETVLLSKRAPDHLPLRDAIQPLRLKDRFVIPGINTLMLVRDPQRPDEPERAHFVFMDREGIGQTAMGLFHVAPAGEFQPINGIDVEPPAADEDFDLWHNIVREAIEELRLYNEPDGVKVNYHELTSTEDRYLRSYEEWCAQLCQMLKDQRVKVYYLGTGLDPLTLKGEILLTAVWEQDAFESCFPEFHEIRNYKERAATDLDRPSEQKQGVVKIKEGKLLWLEFNEHTVRHFTDEAATLASGATCLSLAWKRKGYLFT